MPNLDFAGGLLNSYFDTINQERTRQDQNKLAAANFLLQSGRLKDYNDLLPIIGDLGEPGISVKKGAGGKSKGAISHHDVLGALINPILQGQTGGAAAPTSGVAGAMAPPAATTSGQTNPPGAPMASAVPASPAAAAPASRGPLFTEDEMLARHNAALDRERAANLDVFKQQQQAETQRQVAVEHARYRNIPWAPGNVAGKDIPADTTQDTLGNPIDRASGNYRTRVLPNGDREYMPVTAAPKVATPPTVGSFGDYVLSKQKESGTKLDSKGVLAALTEYQRAKGVMTPGERQAMAKDLATFRAGLGTPEAEDIPVLAQTATIGTKVTPYFDISTAKDKPLAQKRAIQQGIIPVDKAQAAQLGAASAASANLHGFLDQIKSKLPADAQSRPLASLENVYLGQLFQSDTDLASAVAWDTTVVPLLRGLSDTGRLSNVHMQMALAARPKITDTVGAATKKVDILDSVLANAANQVLTRGVHNATGGPGAAGGPAAALRVRARQFLLSQHKQADDATITTFLKNNPQFGKQ
jgi:hypothetical protein